MIKTPKTHPDHETVGHFLDGYDGKVYYCDSYDPAHGFWLTEHKNNTNRFNVSEAAIGRTFHLIHKQFDGSGFSRYRTIRKENMPQLEETPN